MSENRSWQTGRVTDRPTDIAPDGSRIHALPAGRLGSLARCVLPAGRVARPVRHRTVEEVWYVVGGHGQLWRSDDTGQEIVELEPGTGLTIPTGVAFQFRAIGEDDLEVILTTMPPWPGPQEAVPADGPWEPRLDESWLDES